MIKKSQLIVNLLFGTYNAFQDDFDHYTKTAIELDWVTLSIFLTLQIFVWLLFFYNKFINKKK